MHHLQEVEGMSLKAVEYLVFDEADRLFEMGFSEQLKEARGHGRGRGLCVAQAAPGGCMLLQTASRRARPPALCLTNPQT